MLTLLCHVFHGLIAVCVAATCRRLQQMAQAPLPVATAGGHGQCLPISRAQCLGIVEVTLLIHITSLSSCR